jgi:hypothetical protein
LEALGEREHVLVAKAVLELGERAERQAQIEGWPSRQASISPRCGFGIGSSLGNRRWWWIAG